MIYYCIPAHDEAKTVGLVLWKVRQVMAELPRDYEILLADDASTDRSPEVLDPYRRVLPLVLMRNQIRRGYAATLEMLLRDAVRRSRYPRRDVIIVLQADFTDDPDQAVNLLKKIESGADIAAGGPVTDASKRPLGERLSLWFARRSLRRFEWPPLADPLHGMTAYRLACVRKAVEDSAHRRLLPWDGPAANAALLLAAAPHARRIDVTDVTRFPGRAQRPRRFRSLELIRQVRALAAGDVPDRLLTPDRLVPDEVHGDLSVLRDPPPNGQDPSRETDSDAERADSRKSSARKPRTGRRTDKDRPRKPRRRSAAGSAASSPAGTAKSAESETGRPPRRRRPRKRRPPGSADGQLDASSTREDGQEPTAPAGEEPARSRPRRRRRGGRGRRGPRRGSGTDAATPGSADESGGAETSESGT